MNLELLPNFILYKIIIYSLSISKCDIEYNLNLKLVSKSWYNTIKSVKFWKDYSKLIYFNVNYLLDEKDNIYNHYQYLLKRYLDRHKQEESKNLKQKLYLERILFEKEHYNQNNILQHHDFFYLYKLINDEIYQIFGNELLKIPVCYFKDSKCIDNLCEHGCSLNFHGLLEYATNYVMRGIDDKNRFYILFFYKNNVTKRINYEFIFPLEIYHSSFKVQLFTYSGSPDGSYIGNLSFILNQNIPTLIRHFKRELTDLSYNYMERLINFQPCGFTYFDSDSGNFVESKKIYNDKSVVELYFNKDEIQRQIEYDFYYND
jgi:hypothetical protein